MAPRFFLLFQELLEILQSEALLVPNGSRFGSPTVHINGFSVKAEKVVRALGNILGPQFISSSSLPLLCKNYYFSVGTNVH
jgi:hypothetical protein